MGLFDFLKKAWNESTKKEQQGSLTVSMHYETKEERIQRLEDSFVPVESRLSTLFPNKFGLYPHEILIIELCSNFDNEQFSFDEKWKYTYGIKDVKAVLNNLQDKGYIEEGSLQEGMLTYKVTELKDQLAKHNLSQSGTKAVLVDRLINSVSESDLKSSFTRRKYMITEKGKEAISEDKYILYIYNYPKYHLDIYSLNQLLKGKTIHYRDAIWRHLNNCLLDNVSNTSTMSWIEDDMAKFLQEENKYDEALVHVISSAYYQLNNFYNGTSQLPIKDRLEVLATVCFPYDENNTNSLSHRAVVSLYNECLSKIATDEKTARNIMKTAADKLSLPMEIFTPDDSIEILVAEANHDTELLIKLYKKVEKNLKKRYPDLDIRKY